MPTANCFFLKHQYGATLSLCILKVGVPGFNGNGVNFIAGGIVDGDGKTDIE
jgi:hypothetical protein